MYLLTLLLRINFCNRKMKVFIKILAGVVVAVLLIKLLTAIVFVPWLGRIMDAELNKENGNYIVEIDKIHILIVESGIELDGISIYSKQMHGGSPDLMAEIESLKLKGISLVKAILWHNIHISTVTISNSIIKGKIPFSESALPPIVSPFRIGIGRLLFEKVNLEMKNDSTAQSYSLKDGVLKIYDLLVEKQDTVFPGAIKLFDYEAGEIESVSPGNMYTYKITGTSYTAASNTLTIDSLYIHPNYSDYDFTSRYKYQTNRIEAVLSNIYIHDFYHSGQFRSMSLVSPYFEIGKMDIKIFKDKRKEFMHTIKPALQDMLYAWPGTIRIDSIGLTNGDVVLTVHAGKANEAGSISFNEINAKLYNITNDTVYKTETAYLGIKAEALLMGKGKMTLSFKGKLFEKGNPFTMNGSLSNLEIKELNPILEKNAFIYASSGRIDEMYFSHTANNTRAAGTLTILYNGLNVTVKNKQTDDTTAFRERFISFIANRRILDSNPVAHEKVRVGIIDYERDPERLIFHYWFNSILSGITSSLTRNNRKMK